MQKSNHFLTVIAKLIFLSLSFASTPALAIAPDTPIAVSPVANDNYPEGASITYEWNPVAGAEFYDFRLYDRHTLSYVFRDKLVSPATACNETLCTFTPPGEAHLPIGERHLWQIAASNSTGRSDRDTTSFNIVSTMGLPDVPTSLSPAANHSYTEGFNISYEWNPVAGAEFYDFRLYDRGSSSYVFRDKQVSPSTACNETLCTFTPPAEMLLPIGERHLWQIAASNSAGRSARDTTAFNIISAVSLPSVPISLSPAANENLIEGVSISYKWNPVAGAEFYDFRLYDRTNSSYVFRDKQVSPAAACNETLCSFTPADEALLPISERHLWQIAASNSAGRSDRETTSFNIISAMGPPSMPDALSPVANSSYTEGVSITYEWNPVAGAELYDFRLYDRTSLSYVFRDKQVSPSNACSDNLCTFTPPDQALLPMGERHLWQIAASNSAGRSERATTSFDITPDSINFKGLPTIEQYKLVFQDEFDGSELDPSKWDTSLLWGPYLPINNEQQFYVDTLGMHSDFEHSPFELTGDTLKITATPVSTDLQPPPRPPEADPAWKPKPYSEYRYNGPSVNPQSGEQDPGYLPENVDYLSGIITSYGSFKMTHGYVEMRAKMSGGRGLWPAFWGLPTHYVETVPEIDVMEFLGQDLDTIYNTYHYFDIADNWKKISTPSSPVVSSDWTKEFHRYGMSWSPRKIIWYVDGVKTYEIDDSEYRIANQPMYFIANLAVGGNWPGPPDATTPFPATLEIDYIRAYKKDREDTLELDQDYQIMFQDEFNGTSLDPDKWNTHFLWGPYLPINNEEQYYIDSLGADSNLLYSPFNVVNGILTINAHESSDPAAVPPPQSLPDSNNQIWTQFPTFQQNSDYEPPAYTSGMITSYDSFKFANGYAEIRAKIPKGAGLWPAFWLLNGYYVGQQPEIDILEVRGENPHQVINSYHRLDAEGSLLSDSYTTTYENEVEGYSDDFHRYGALWEPGKITWYIDGQAVHSYESDDVGYQVMYVIANLAVGGDFNFSATDPNSIPAKLEIDYIRIYQEKDPE